MILITGGTGFIGRHVTERLLAIGYRVRLLVPEGSEVDISENPLLSVVYGTLGNDEVLFRAVTGINTIIHLESGQWWASRRQLERVELLGTRNLIEAARAARVGRIIVMSHIGTTPASAYPLLRVKGNMEELVRGSGLAYTIVRSGLVFGEDDAFYNNIAMMLAINPVIFVMPGRGEGVIHPLYVGDLVEILRQTLETIDTVDTTIEIGGPEYITLRDLIRTIMRVTGRQRIILSTQPYLMRFSMRLGSFFTRRQLMTPQWLDLLATNRAAQLSTTAKYFDIQLHRLEDTMLTYLPGGRYGLWKALRYRLRGRPRKDI